MWWLYYYLSCIRGWVRRTVQRTRCLPWRWQFPAISRFVLRWMWCATLSKNEMFCWGCSPCCSLARYFWALSFWFVWGLRFFRHHCINTPLYRFCSVWQAMELWHISFVIWFGKRSVFMWMVFFWFRNCWAFWFQFWVQPYFACVFCGVSVIISSLRYSKSMRICAKRDCASLWNLSGKSPCILMCGVRK